ncbi:hypothetical protein [Pseudomonas sp. URMO17WK12:I11]|uniref:hypothetical protein n=1 Tax=Pseudomonas sp. URMO17WK12:I11 TaxID=1283291 RepID=UPI0011A62E0C|nr:hypothetical protein [Pseudomonas sp. URMO17WK12:I11]
MAAKIEYVVVDGCVQDGTKTVRKGEVYVPPSVEVREFLIAEGRIVARGKLDSSGSRAPKRAAAPSPTPSPAPTDDGGEEDEEEEEEEDEEKDDLDQGN